MASIGDLIVKLRANTAGFTKPLKNASKDIGMFSKGLGSLAGAGGLVAGGLLATAGAVNVAKRAFRAFTNEISASLERLDSLAKTSARLNILPDKLAALQFSAELSGASIKELETGLQNLARRGSEAAEGTGEGVDALKKLGIEAERFNKLSVDQQFRKVAAAMGTVKNQNDKVAIAFDLFGRSGVKLLNTLDGGVGKLESDLARLHSLGGVFTRDELARVEAVNDQMNELRRSIEGTADRLTIEMAPGLLGAAQGATIFGETMVKASKSINPVARAIASLPDMPAITKMDAFLELNKRLAKVFVENADALDRQIKLDRQIATLKKKRQVDETGALEKRDAAKRVEESLKTFAGGVKESLLTPLERFERERDKLNALFFAKGNLLSADQGNQAIANLKKTLDLETGRTAELDKQAKLIQDGIAKQEQANAALRASAKQVFDQTRTPFERFRKEVERLKKLFAGDFINADTLGRAIGGAREQFEDAAGGPSDTSVTRALAGTEVGSKEFFDKLQNQQGGSPEAKTAKNTAKLAAAQEEQRAILTRIESNTDRPSLQPSALGAS